MSYTALYRKLRPDSFEGVVGQDHIVKTLTNQIMSGRVGHAYLLCGTRGTGKTSTAKIFAKAVNCENPNQGNPCGVCQICLNIQRNQSMNIIEIDAASNNGVDNIREIREETRYTPTEGKYKVYIVDEVHMLSQGAFNALLKTLEEPPSHVIFILATTEPHKLPATILSRCQRYDFKRISTQVIATTLMSYMKDEQVEVEDQALYYIGKAADGSMRDALSILDQCIAFYMGEKITLSKVQDVLGAVDTSVFVNMVDLLTTRNVEEIMKLVEEITMQGRDLSQWINDLIQYIRNLLIIKAVGTKESILDLSTEDLESLLRQSGILHQDEIVYYIKNLSELEQKIKFASQKRVLVEIELLKLCQSTGDESREGVLERLRRIEKQLDDGVKVTEVIREVKAVAVPNNQMKKTVNIEAIPQDIQQAIAKYELLVNKFEGLDKAILRKVTPANLEDNTLYLICEEEVQKQRLTDPIVLEALNDSLSELHGLKFHLRILTVNEFDLIAHEVKDTTTGNLEAKNLFEQIKSKINFDDIKEIKQ